MDRMSAWDSPALDESWFGKRNQKPRGSSPEDYGARAPGDKTPRGSSPEDYGAIASLMPDNDDPPRQTGEDEVKPSKPQGDPGQPSTYEGEGNYKYQVAPDGRIYILQSGYKGQIRDYTSAPREVKKGTGAYNAIVAELNRVHKLDLKPAPVVSRPAAPPASPPAPGDRNAKPQDATKPAETPPAASVTSRKPPPIPATSAPGQGGMEPGQTQEWMSKLQQAKGIARSLYGEEAGSRWIEQYTVKHGAYLPQVNEMLSILQREQDADLRARAASMPAGGAVEDVDPVGEYLALSQARWSVPKWEVVPGQIDVPLQDTASAIKRDPFAPVLFDLPAVEVDPVGEYLETAEIPLSL